MAKKRRDRGDGSVFERTDGRWCGVFDLGIGSDGKRDRRYVYGRNKTETKDKLRTLQHDAKDGKLVDPSTLTVATHLKNWMDAPGRKWEPTTRASYNRNIRLHINPALGRIPLQKLKPADLMGLYSSMKARGLSGRMQQYAHAILRHALGDAFKDGLVAGNVADMLRKTQKPRADAPEARFFNREQAEKFLEAIKGDEFENLYIVAIAGGMRQGEMLALRPEDVDLETGLVEIRRKVVEEGGQFHLGKPKSKKGIRAVALPDFAVEALRSQIAVVKAAGLDSGGLVFPNSKGTYLRRNGVGQRFRKLLKKLELPVIRFHDLRHTNASLLLREGVHPKVVQERLGHATIAITLDTYSHVMPGMQKEAAGKLEGLFGKKAVAKKAKAKKTAPKRGRNAKPNP